jgi:hypothetical protein
MASGYTFECTHCKYSFMAWDDGNPYFRSDKGRPQFFYHPDEGRLFEYVSQSVGRDLTGEALNEFLKKRTGNMTDMLCLDCGRRFKRDLRRQKPVCPSRKCKSANISDLCELEDKICPKCKQGVFKCDPDNVAIS